MEYLHLKHHCHILQIAKGQFKCCHPISYLYMVKNNTHENSYHIEFHSDSIHIYMNITHFRKDSWIIHYSLIMDPPPSSLRDGQYVDTQLDVVSPIRYDDYNRLVSEGLGLARIIIGALAVVLQIPATVLSVSPVWQNYVMAGIWGGALVG